MSPSPAASKKKYQPSVLQCRLTRSRASEAQKAADSLLFRSLSQKRQSAPSSQQRNPPLVSLSQHNCPFIDIDLPPVPSSPPGPRTSLMSHHPGPPSMSSFGFAPSDPSLFLLGTNFTQQGFSDGTSQMPYSLVDYTPNSQNSQGYLNGAFTYQDQSRVTPLAMGQPDLLSHPSMFPNQLLPPNNHHSSPQNVHHTQNFHHMGGNAPQPQNNHLMSRNAPQPPPEQYLPPPVPVPVSTHGLSTPACPQPSMLQTTTRAHPLPTWNQLNNDAEAQWLAQAQKATKAQKAAKKGNSVQRQRKKKATATTAAPGTTTLSLSAPAPAATPNTHLSDNAAEELPIDDRATCASNPSPKAERDTLTLDPAPAEPQSPHLDPTAALTSETRTTVVPVNGPASQRRLEPDVVALYAHESLEELRRIARTFGENHFLTAEHRLELNQIYKNYQRELHIMAITNKLAPQPALRYVGAKSCIRGATSYNNFCLYNPEASKIHHDYTKTSKERAKQTGALWKKLNKQEKRKYRDHDYLKTFPNPYIHIQQAAEARAAAGQPNVDEAGVQLGPKSSRRQYVDLKPEQWAKKTLLDLKRIGEAYQTEGFLVLVTQRGKQSRITAGGSYLGQQYVDMTELGEDRTGPIQDFRKFVNGHKVIKKLTGLEPPPVVKPKNLRKGRVVLADGKYDKGSKRKNLSDV
ncbi:hypothetical protein PCASD_07486 [Puccinia coronata f. sp. avenae]|uniref:Uncharacterized protein n=1 Tax=Puccinia coronata f. sp. avenae TaxID=200324 RepID=A0A2N5V0B4_9BASI|nr:hypothetical protein PCASD_07486 [Puccinia coronata f. sp. avenae]